MGKEMATSQLSGNLHLSCPQCRKRKIKCDRKYPCGQCKVRGEEDTCEAVIRKYSTVKGVDDGDEVEQKQENSILLQRLKTLEQRVDQLEENERRTKKENSVQHSPTDTHSRKSKNVDHERVSLMVEDVAMGHLGKRNRFDEPITVKKRLIEDSNVLQQRTYDHVIDIVYLYNQFIPHQNQQTIVSLIQFYFDQINWFTNVIEQDEFLQEYKEWKGTNFDVKKVDPCFFCCFLMVLVLSLHTMEEEDLRSIGILKSKEDKTSHINLAQSLFAGSQQILWSSNFLGNCQLDHLACIILMGLYQYDKKDESDAHWILLGSAIKAAQNMGLDDGSKSLTAREKEIWWMLVWYDWSHAFGHDGHYSILSTKNSFALQDDQSKFSLARIRLVNFYRSVTDVYNETDGQLTQEKIDDLDIELESIIKQIPTELIVNQSVQSQSNTIQQTFEKYFISLTIQNRILRLHRPFQVDEEDTQDKSSSREKCLQAALQIVSLLQQAYQLIPTLCKFWVINLYCLGAGLVLVIEQRQRKENKSIEIENQLNTLMNIFAKNQRRSASARNGFRLLRILRKMDQDLQGQESYPQQKSSEKRTIMKQVADLFLKQAAGGDIDGQIENNAELNHPLTSQDQQITLFTTENSIDSAFDNNQWNIQGNPTDLLDFTFSNWQQALNAYGLRIDFDQIG